MTKELDHQHHPLKIKTLIKTYFKNNTPPHTTHPTPTDTSPYAIEDTQIDTEPPSNTEPPSHTPHVQDSKRANKKIRCVGTQLNKKK